jgi:hypothetical protein
MNNRKNISRPTIPPLLFHLIFLDLWYKPLLENGEEAIKKLQKYAELGFTEIVLTNSTPNRDKVVDLIANDISPHFASYNKLEQPRPYRKFHVQ